MKMLLLLKDIVSNPGLEETNVSNGSMKVLMFYGFAKLLHNKEIR